MGMNITQLIHRVSKYYPEDYIRVHCWDDKKKTVRRGQGDTLAEFIASDLDECFHPEADELTQLRAARVSMTRALKELEAICVGLTNEIEYARGRKVNGDF